MSQKSLPNRDKRWGIPGFRIRKDIRSLSKDELDVLVKAFVWIQKNPPEPDNPHPKSFFTIAGFHGEPFRGAGYGNPSWWGGYCNHGNVLFPTWHRAYLLCLEEALRKAPGCGDVALPYWNELDVDNVLHSWNFPDGGDDALSSWKQLDAADKEALRKDLDSGNFALPYWERAPIPKIFLQKEYAYKNTKEKFPNPLYSYRFQKAIYDRLRPIPDADYSKNIDYETVRYPFSGLVGANDAAATKAHNQLMTTLGERKTTELLQSNVSNWLIGTVTNSDGKIVGGGTRDNYIQSLFAPNYTVFSNTTSAQRWNDDKFDSSQSGDTDEADIAVVPLEKPHNSIHLAVGGFDVPGFTNYSYVPDANGDMGENDTAAFDPIFYFHHCFIDLVFWAWQLKHEKTDELDIISMYPGTNSVDSQGPTPGIPGGTWLSLDTPLDPFVKDDLGKPEKPMTSKCPVVKHAILRRPGEPTIWDLHYDYDYLAEYLSKLVQQPNELATPHIRISGVNRADAKGSFFLSAWASGPDSDTQTLVGLEPVLSRWHVAGCANCNTHLNVSTVISLPGWKLSDAARTNFDVLVHTRNKRFGRPSLGGKTPNIRLGKMLVGGK